MKKHFIGLLLVIIIIFCPIVTVSAARNWITVNQTPTIDYQIDKETMNLSTTETDRELDVWMRMVLKDQGGMTIVGHYLIRESDLSFILKERITYSASEAVLGSVDATGKGWVATTEKSPIGSISRRLFADYRENQKLTDSRILINNNYFTQYENQAKGFAVKYPEEWKRKDGVKGLTFISPLTSANDKFLENVNISVIDFPNSAGLSLNALDEIITAKTKERVTDYKLIQKENCTLSGIPAISQLYSGRNGILELRFMQIYTVANYKAYVFTFAGEEGQYSNYEEIIQEMMKSFTIFK